MIEVSNDQFLECIFGDQSPLAHVTDFTFDPNDIPKGHHLMSWMGNYNQAYHLTPNSNQYFTISNFYCDENQKARRRKALFRSTPCIVLDDVREKLSIDEVSKLPIPSWILETSEGSEQWGYILDKPCIHRSMVENLLDGLVKNGLAPDGRDPGMRGVTRYVRLPEGSNNKSTKLVDGKPFKCRMLHWQPFNRVTIEQLAVPFDVNLYTPISNGVESAASIPDHPLMQHINIKSTRSAGRYDITCPWVEEHTDEDNSGSALFTNVDGSYGFKCHHGACQDRTGRHLMQYLDQVSPGIMNEFKSWQIERSFDALGFNKSASKEVSFLEPLVEQVSFLEPLVEQVSFLEPLVEQVSFLEIPRVDRGPVASFLQPVTNFLAQPSVVTTPIINNLNTTISSIIEKLKKTHPNDENSRVMAAELLKHIDDLPKIDQHHYHTQICDVMMWNKTEFKEILKDLRSNWYEKEVDESFYDNVVYVKELNQFYDSKARLFLSPEAFHNSFCHIDSEARKKALTDGRVIKVDKLDYAPKEKPLFLDNDILFSNTWNNSSQSTGAPGDVQAWLNHFDVLGWGENRKHIIQWMAYTLRFPENKINHMLILGGGEGCGKDFLLYPLARAMGDNYMVVSGEELNSEFNDYLLGTKFLHINETELGDRRESALINNRLKPLAAAPPDTIRVNQKGIKHIKVRNIVNSIMTTNSPLPITTTGVTRRFYGVWSDFNMRDEHDDVYPEWQKYWDDMWSWMKVDGWKHVTNYLMTQVDLSDFNPFKAPPMTEFIREIRESSKKPLLRTIETFIKDNTGIFSCDMITSLDIAQSIKNSVMFAEDTLEVNPKFVTANKVGATLRTDGKIRSAQIRVGGNLSKVWLIHNAHKYNGMDNIDMAVIYRAQRKQALGKHGLSLVR